jgi:60 kDa SS-A/Ro ribonucleoprotein
MKPRTATTKLNKLFGTTAYATATTRNYEGAPAFVRGDEEQLVRVLMTGSFEPTFYASDTELAGEAIGLFRHFAANDPHFLAQAIIYARNEGHMRVAPITALVVLSAAEAPEAKELFRRAFPKVISTPGDLQDFLTLCRGSALRGMGKAVTRASNRWLAGMSQYHAIKYGSEAQRMSLRDIYRMTRPKLAGEANAIARYLVKGAVAPELTQIAGYEEFKREARDFNERRKTLDADVLAAAEQGLLARVAEHRLPWEVVAGQAPASAALWEAMCYQMPYMALLRGVNNAVKYGVTERPEALAYIANTLADPHRVETSRQLPFRFYSALKALKAEGETGEVLHTALELALEHSFVNMPELGRRVLVANDISGSMSSRPSARSDMTMSEIAGIFAAAVFKKAEQGEIVSFDTAAHPRSVSKSDGLADIARTVSEIAGGTSLSAPIDYAFGRREGMRVYDVAVFLTDSESWYDHLTRNRGVLDLIREYKARVNPALACFFVQLLPYKHAVVPQTEPGCYYIYGWSASILDYIVSVLGGGHTQVEAVRQVSVL